MEPASVISVDGFLPSDLLSMLAATSANSRPQREYSLGKATCSAMHVAFFLAMINCRENFSNVMQVPKFKYEIKFLCHSTSGCTRMRYRLALQISSSTLGWAILRIDDAGAPAAVIRAGVRLFNDGRSPFDGATLSVTRRQARAQRRRRDRKNKRKKRLQMTLARYGFMPSNPSLLNGLYALNPYLLRASGLDRELKPDEFGRALIHLNQRRGFKSNRVADTNDSRSGAQKKAINALHTQLEATKYRTVGEWFWKVRMEGRPEGVAGQGVRARYRLTQNIQNGKKQTISDYDLYVDRSMVAQEFDVLWAAQAKFNPSLYNEAARTELRDTLLFQRNLQPVKPGRCALMPEEERAPLALPTTQRFRIYQEANNLRVLHPDLREVPLTLTERDQVVELLESKSRVTFAHVRKALGLSSATQFNLEDAKRHELKGNATNAALGKKDLFGASWAKFDPALQDEIVLQLHKEENEERLVAWLQEHTGVDEIRATAIANTVLPKGHGSLSQKALALILPELQRSVVTYSEAMHTVGLSNHSDLNFDFEHMRQDVEQIGQRVVSYSGEIKPVYAFKQLPYYGRALQRHVTFGSGNPYDPEEKRYGKIANPTVHIGLNQVRVVVNALIRRYGRPAEIVVELTRELKQSREQKMEAQRKQAVNQKRNTRIREQISQMLSISKERVRTTDIQKWILWEELSFDVVDRRCPYSGIQISPAMLLSERIEIDHILPFSRTLDDSFSNRTVTTREANRIKRNRTPWEARKDFEAQGWAYDSILQRAERMPKNKRYRFAVDGYERWLGEDSDFLSKTLNDVRYLSRVCADYLRLVAPGDATRVVSGQITAILRAQFGLNDVLGCYGKVNQDDHRHHAVDACVIGVMDQGLMQRLAQSNSYEMETGLSQLSKRVSPPWPTYRMHVERALNHIWVSHKPDHGHEGAMMEETSYGIRKDGSIKQKKKPDGSFGREIQNLILIAGPRHSTRHGVDPHGQPRPYKGYVSGSNYCIEITLNHLNKWTSRVLSTFEAYQVVRTAGLRQLRNPKTGQSGDPLVMRLTTGDTVRLIHQNDELTLRVLKISASGQIFMAPINEANVDARYRAGALSYVTKTAGTLQKSCARQVTISPIGELRDPGFRGNPTNPAS